MASGSRRWDFSHNTPLCTDVPSLHGCGHGSRRALNRTGMERTASPSARPAASLVSSLFERKSRGRRIYWEWLSGNGAQHPGQGPAFLWGDRAPAASGSPTLLPLLTKPTGIPASGRPTRRTGRQRRSPPWCLGSGRWPEEENPQCAHLCPGDSPGPIGASGPTLRKAGSQVPLG